MGIAFMFHTKNPKARKNFLQSISNFHACLLVCACWCYLILCKTPAANLLSLFFAFINVMPKILDRKNLKILEEFSNFSSFKRGQVGEVMDMVCWHWLDTKCPIRHSTSHLLSRMLCGKWEKMRWKSHLVDQDKDNLLNKSKKNNSLNFPPARNVRPLAGKHSFRKCSTWSGRKIL